MNYIYICFLKLLNIVYLISKPQARILAKYYQSIAAKLSLQKTHIIQNNLINIIKSYAKNKLLNIGIYSCLDDELDVDFLIKQYDKANYYYPLIDKDSKNKALTFIKYHHSLAFSSKKQPFNINQPLIKNNKKYDTLPVSGFDIIIVPMLGFNNKKARLGRGKGYYDINLNNSKQKPVLIGICLYKQKINFKNNIWDIIYDIIITDKGIIK